MACQCKVTKVPEANFTCNCWRAGASPVYRQDPNLVITAPESVLTSLDVGPSTGKVLIEKLGIDGLVQGRRNSTALH